MDMFTAYGHIKSDLSPLYIMNKFVTNKSKLPQDGAQVFPITPIYGVIGYHVTL